MTPYKLEQTLKNITALHLVYCNEMGKLWEKLKKELQDERASKD